jgi:hypothetical protein
MKKDYKKIDEIGLCLISQNLLDFNEYFKLEEQATKFWNGLLIWGIEGYGIKRYWFYVWVEEQAEEIIRDLKI